ncbi:MAG: DUF2333 family protein [Pseudomonadales bacterium]
MRVPRVVSVMILGRGSRSLRPGGLHPMLFNPRHPVRAGDAVPLRLEFDDGTRLEIDVATTHRGIMNTLRNTWQQMMGRLPVPRVSGWKLPMRIGAGVLGVYILLCIVLGFIWDHEPDAISVREQAARMMEAQNREVVTGVTTTATLIALAETLLDKRGGYLTNDIFPPSIWMDNVPNWEFGVLVQLRDMSRIMRNDLSRSQSQSREDPALVDAEGKFFYRNDSWIFPETENEYRDGINHLRNYLERLSDPGNPKAQFYARADNLASWLAAVETRLGSLSQRLSTSVGKRQLDLGLAGDSAASRATEVPVDEEIQTPWLELDDVFYEARGHTWALIHLLRAVDIDFAEVLEDKNARVSLQQIIRELEPTQDPMWSPVILNGTGFGMLANHSLVMASYVSRANAAIIDLRNLLAKG